MKKLLLIVSLTFCLGSTYRQQVDKIERQMDEVIEHLKRVKKSDKTTIAVFFTLAGIMSLNLAWEMACGEKSLAECRRERQIDKKIAECRKEGNKGIMECIHEAEAEYGQSN